MIAVPHDTRGSPGEDKNKGLNQDLQDYGITMITTSDSLASAFCPMSSRLPSFS